MKAHIGKTSWWQYIFYSYLALDCSGTETFDICFCHTQFYLILSFLLFFNNLFLFSFGWHSGAVVSNVLGISRWEISSENMHMDKDMDRERIEWMDLEEIKRCSNLKWIIYNTTWSTGEEEIGAEIGEENGQFECDMI